MSKFENLEGKKFGNLTVIERVKTEKYKWRCICDCGNETVVIAYGIVNGTTRSCGCLKIKESTKRLNAFNKKYNTYDLSGEYGIGYTTKGEEFYFDLEDYDKIKDYCWFMNGEGYATSRINNKKHFLHRYLINTTGNNLVDHINKNRIDNRKINLRVCTKSDNNININLRKDNSSGVTGVYWNKSSNNWLILLHYKHKKHIEHANTLDEAIRKRLLLEIKVLGYDLSPQKHLFEIYGIDKEELLNEKIS